jgi:protein TonB
LAGAAGPFGATGDSQNLLDIFSMEDLEKKPELVAAVPPQYPPEMRKAKVEGVVTIVCVLDESGRVEDPRVEASSRPEFERPALDAVRRWKFRPGMREGEAVRTYMRLPIRFSINS